MLILEHDVAQVVGNYQICDQTSDWIRYQEHHVDQSEEAGSKVEVDEVNQAAS